MADLTFRDVLDVVDKLILPAIGYVIYQLQAIQERTGSIEDRVILTASKLEEHLKQDDQRFQQHDQRLGDAGRRIERLEDRGLLPRPSTVVS